MSLGSADPLDRDTERIDLTQCGLTFVSWDVLHLHDADADAGPRCGDCFPLDGGDESDWMYVSNDVTKIVCTELRLHHHRRWLRWQRRHRTRGAVRGRRRAPPAVAGPHRRGGEGPVIEALVFVLILLAAEWIDLRYGDTSPDRPR